MAWIADATSVREIVKDSLGNQIWDQVTAVGNGQNLAGASGSSFVGFQQAGFGATVRTSQDKARERVSVYDFMTPAQIVGSQTPTSVDHTSAFQEAANACLAAGVDSHLHIPRGTYNLSAPVNIAFSGVVSGSGM